MGYSSPSSSVKFDANGNVLTNVNAQNITPNVNTVNAPNVNAINNPPLRHKFMTSLITSTTSTTNVTLGTYVSSNGIGNVFTYNHVTGSNTIYFSLNNGSTVLIGSNLNPFAYSPQGSATLSLEGYVSAGTGYYNVIVYEVF